MYKTAAIKYNSMESINTFLQYTNTRHKDIILLDWTRQN
jgi:hypothetical protein